MKNITLSVHDGVLAADRNCSVNSLLRDYLSTLAAHDDRAECAASRKSLSVNNKG